MSRARLEQREAGKPSEGAGIRTDLQQTEIKMAQLIHAEGSDLKDAWDGGQDRRPDQEVVCAGASVKKAGETPS